MRWLFGILVLVNVALFLYSVGHRAEPPAGLEPARAPVNSAAMALLPPAPGGEPKALPRGGSCAEFGPFADQAALSEARERAETAALEVLAEPRRRRAVAVLRVLAGPFADPQEAEAVRESLQQNGYGGAGVETDPDGRTLIDVATVESEDAAQAIVERLADLGLSGRIRREPGRQRDERSLIVRLAGSDGSEPDPAAAALGGAGRPVDCPPAS